MSEMTQAFTKYVNENREAIRKLSIVASAEITIDPETNAIYDGLSEVERERRLQTAVDVARGNIERLFVGMDNVNVNVELVEKEGE